jgi:two-component system sensor histidine kinase RpfC
MAVSRLRTRFLAPFTWLSRSRGNDILGRERGQALLRVVVSTIVAGYLFYSDPVTTIADRVPTWLVIAGYAAVSITVLVWTLRSTVSLAVRRYIANTADICAISYAMVFAGESGMPLFLLYLWVTLGNGFRYGTSALIVSAVLAVGGFGIVVSLTEAWQTHQALSTSVVLALIILPLYAAHLITQLNRALAHAQEASAAKGQFLARMSHELRTPLNGVLGATELLESGRRLAPEDQALLQVIRESVQVSLSQINNVLDLSKLESGKLVLERIPFDLHELLNTTARMVRPAAVQKSLRFVVRVAPETVYLLLGDTHHLRAVLLNLLSNAVKFTERGYVSLDVFAREDLAERTTVRFEVHDTGVGIAPSALERIFESFAQEDAGTTRRFGGTGLGTTIAKQLTELMGGRIGVQSVKGRGTVFWCEIPFDKQRPVNEAGPLPGTRVVLATQDEEVARHYTRILDTLETELIRVRSRQEALDSIERSVRLGNPVHAVLVDAALAIEDIAAAQRSALYERLASAAIPLLMVSDIALDAAQLRQLGYSAVLARTADRTRLHSALHAVRAPFEPPQPGVVNVPPWLWNQRRGVRRRLLVADDNRTNLMIVRRILEEAGYEIDVAESGDVALERLSQGRYRLAVLDMHMPGLDGLGVLRQYRARQPRSRLPVIMLTANVSLEAQRQCADSGASAYLAKPVRAADLLGEIERLLREHEVESIQPFVSRADGARTPAEPRLELVDGGVLAELDRLYRDPHELARTIDEYEREGRELLDRIGRACFTGNHAAYCDAVHAFKGNATNVGASRLIQLCRETEGAGIVEFLRNRDQTLATMRQTFDDTLVALRDMIPSAAPGTRDGPIPGASH